MTREQIIKHWDVIQAYKNGKTIQVLLKGKWEDENNPQFYLNMDYRIKPESTKRLPTLEEVEKWFLENRVFIYKSKNILNRIDNFDRNNEDNEAVRIGDKWTKMKEFCEFFTHLDGSELYITEN